MRWVFRVLDIQQFAISHYTIAVRFFIFYSNSNSGRYFLLNRLSTINNEGSRKDGSSNPLFLTFK
jgi:hypothetical protein